MKKMLILALLPLFYIVFSAVTVPQTVPVDNDVGIYRFVSADQVQPDMNIVADNSSPLYFSDYVVPVYADVGSAVCINNPTTLQEILWQSSETTTIERTTATYNQAIKEGLLRTDTGESHSHDRVLSRHIT